MGLSTGGEGKRARGEYRILLAEQDLVAVAVRRTLASTNCRIADPTLVPRPRQLRDASTVMRFRPAHQSMINRRCDGRVSGPARNSPKPALETKPRIHTPATWNSGHESGWWRPNSLSTQTFYFGSGPKRVPSCSFPMNGAVRKAAVTQRKDQAMMWKRLASNCAALAFCAAISAPVFAADDDWQASVGQALGKSGAAAPELGFVGDVEPNSPAQASASEKLCSGR